MVVRDPFTRLISIFRERFNSQNRAQFENFQGRYQREVDKYTQEDKDHIVEPHFNTSFSAFVRFLANNPDEHNSAWDPIFEMCHPCYIRYFSFLNGMLMGESLGTITLPNKRISKRKYKHF